MRCFICLSDATDFAFAQGGRAVDCAHCGPYCISASALYLYHRDLWVLSVARSRDWLGLRREAGEDRPLIDSQTYLCD